jgi:hypothetical protein|tara:strand:- start:1273 stop:1404 length:132 start_codon:yes stop_codon:yes gene_type:complete
VVNTPIKKTWGLVQMDGTSKLQWNLKKEKKRNNPRLWKSDWKK